MQKTLTVALFAMLWGMAGCASIINGHTQQVTFKSVPPGAQVKINGMKVCVTPCSAEVQRSGDQILAMSLPGYSVYSATMSKTVSGAFWGDILWSGPVGMIIDLSTGGMWRFKSKELGHVFDPSQTVSIRELWAHPERQNDFRHLAALSPEEQDRVILDLFAEEQDGLVSYAKEVLKLEWCDPEGAAHYRDVVRRATTSSISKEDLALLKKLCEKGVLGKAKQ